mgnify:CR=1 FL=1
MADISKHHTEQKWETDNGEHGWIDLFVLWNTISVNDNLELLSE